MTSQPAGGPVATLSMPVYYLLDGQLHVLDPQGRTRDLDLAAEEIIGSTTESVYVIDTDSTVQRFDSRHGDDGPESPWTFERVAAPVEGPVQSARLSADGRWLGWIDLDDRLGVRDLVADREAGPRRLPTNSYLADVAQGTGAALISQDGDLVLRAADGDVQVPTALDGYGWASTASAERVAVVDRDATTRVYDVATGTAVLVGEVPGSGYLSPYGDALTTVHSVKGSAEALLWSAGRRADAAAGAGAGAGRGLGRRRHGPRRLRGRCQPPSCTPATAGSAPCAPPDRRRAPDAGTLRRPGPRGFRCARAGRR